MAFTVLLQTVGPVPPRTDLAEWLIEQGEPYTEEGPQTLALRGLPVRLVIEQEEGVIQAQLEITPTLPLMRLIDLLFDLSVVAGADVRLAGMGDVSRPTLWMRLADEQDRQRIQTAILRSVEYGNQEEVLRRLWSVLAVIQPGVDIRWRAEHASIVFMKEVGADGGISIEEAAWHSTAPTLGDLIAIPVVTYQHSLAWRWLSEAYPGLQEPSSY